MQWTTPTSHIKKKANDWFASIIVLAGALIFITILLGNYILMMLIIAIAIALIIVHSAPAEPENIELRTGGLIIGKRLFPWDTIEAFAIQDYFGVARLILRSKRKISPIISIPIDEENIDIEELRSVLEEIIPEEDIHEPLLHLVMERFGFH